MFIVSTVTDTDLLAEYVHDVPKYTTGSWFQ